MSKPLTFGSSFLKSAIEKRKQETQKIIANSKYKRRGDIEKELLAAKRKEKPGTDSTLHNGASKSESKTLNSTSFSENQQNTLNEEDDDHPVTSTGTIPKEEVIRRLRLLNEPITLFGETDMQRERRMISIETKKNETEFQSGSNNEFGLDIKQLSETDAKDHSDAASRGGMDDFEISETDVKLKEDEILFLFLRLLKEWEVELNERPDSLKKTVQGKVQTANYKQTCRNILPLFRLLKKRELAADILLPMHGIMKAINKRMYVEANDWYLKMAIGNAPWPMGVTMVGIHERSAREKISTHQVAHVLNDETQRKYIQAVKRLISFAQRKHPNAPSHCVG